MSIELSPNQPTHWPTPTDEELVAIVAALDQVWPKPVVSNGPRTPVWRFSNRWWR